MSERSGMGRMVRAWSLGLVAVLGLAGCRHQQSAVVVTPPAAMAPLVSAPAAATVVVEPPVKLGADGTVVGGVRPAPVAPVLRPIQTEVGMASWYGTVYDHRKAANGEVYEQNGLTAASRTLPLGSMARVTNLTTGQVAMLRITDRGPFVPGRIIDLSLGAAKALGVYRMGVAKVKVEGFATAEIAALPARWCVQIGAFASEGDALQVKNELAKRFGTAKVIEFKGPTGSWVRVTAEVPDQARTEEIAARVKVPNAAVVAYVTRTN